MKIRGMEKVRDGKFLKNYKLKYENKAGKEKIYEMVSRNDIRDISELGKGNANGVVIVAKRKTDDSLLLVKEFRMAVNKYIMNFVCGLIDEGETIEDCVKRELFEETGLTDVTVTRILPPAYSAIGISDEKIAVVYAYVDGELNDNSSDNEDITPKFYSKDEVKELLETEEFSCRTQLICDMWVFL